MINSFIENVNQLITYAEIYADEPKTKTWQIIPKVVNWHFGNYCIIHNQNKIDSYRIWNKNDNLYYFIYDGKEIWHGCLQQAVENGWKFYDALALIHRKCGIYYINKE